MHLSMEEYLSSSYKKKPERRNIIYPNKPSWEEAERDYNRGYDAVMKWVYVYLKEGGTAEGLLMEVGEIYPEGCE